MAIATLIATTERLGPCANPDPRRTYGCLSARTFSACRLSDVTVRTSSSPTSEHTNRSERRMPSVRA